MSWLQQLFSAIISIPAKLLITTKVIPGDVQQELGIDPKKPIIYLLKTESVTDQIALKNAAKQLGLPDPDGALEVGLHYIPRCLFLERPQSLFSAKAEASDIAHTFKLLFKQHHQNEQLDLQIIPVSTFWGRAPGKTDASWRALLANKASPNWLRKIFIVLFLGRDNLVYISKAVSSRYMAAEHGSDEQIAHKLIRVARTHFQRRRQAVTGPRQMAREQIIQGVLASAAVQEAIAEEQHGKKISADKAKQRAQQYANEIAGDYREGLIRIAEKMLTKLWNKVYNGLEIRHAEKVRQLAQSGHEIIYVPCHRSHMDYLLLTYVIYHEGLMIPHIAAGINLNFWPAGPIFRRAGAFFIRRSFAGNKLYTAVFREYLEQLFNRGYSVKYYPEGGRSRTGRLLPPKTGMLAMTVQSMFKGLKRPISLVPVYIGYEHVMEVASYLKELRGKDKKKESFWQIFSAIRKLKNYGTGYLNFGDPINLGQFMDKCQPDWRHEVQQNPDKKPSWLTPMVNKLATDVMQRINQATAVNGMNLTSLCLLAADKHALTEAELQRCLTDYLALLQHAPYSQLVTLPEQPASSLLQQTLKLNKFTVQQDSFGRIISLSAPAAIAMTYYRNNILHLFVIPGLIAAMVIANNGMQKTQIVERIALLFPLLKKELFIYLSQSQAQQLCNDTVESMLSVGLLVEDNDKVIAAQRDSQAFFSLMMLNRCIQETLQRYAIVLTLAAKGDKFSRSELEKQSIRLAERLATLHGVTAPEFYDKNVIGALLNAMREMKLLHTDDEGMLAHTEQSRWLLNEISGWLVADVAQNIKHS
ncbi:glycerol-3-phosphate 1-O-acyltransferase PlsB [Neptunicella sp. SCSIO 80796]|uniref:glycerol-3-phosphate 1-O-acyltransferase PlsB n=1 Tax=Neptunicella plasticusilytica TaxID=3117012 RepID=UPI003A4D9A5D